MIPQDEMNKLLQSAKIMPLDSSLDNFTTTENNYKKPADLVTLFEGQNNENTAFCSAILPSKKLVIGTGKSLELWDINNKTLLNSCPNSYGDIYTIAAISNAVLATGGHQSSNRIHLWRINNLETNPVFEELPFLIQLPAYGAVRVFDDILVVNCLGHNKVFVWKISDILTAINTNKNHQPSESDAYNAALLEPQVYTFPENHICFNVVLSHDKKRLIASIGDKSGDNNGKISVISLEKNLVERTFIADLFVGYGLTLLTNGHIASCFNHSSAIRIWDINTGQLVREMLLKNVWQEDDAETKQIRQLKTMQDGTLMCLHTKKLVTLWDTNTGKCVKTMTGSDVLAWDAQILTNNDVLVVGGDPYHAPYSKFGYIWQFAKLNVLERYYEKIKDIPEPRKILLDRIKAENPKLLKVFLNDLEVDWKWYFDVLNVGGCRCHEHHVTDPMLPRLNKLAFYNKQLNSEQISALAWIAGKNPFLKEFVLDSAQLQDIDLVNIGFAIVNHKKLHSLVLTGNPRITSAGIQQLQNILINNYTLWDITLPKHLTASQKAPILQVARRNAELAAKLVQSARKGDSQAVKNLLQQGVSVDYVDIHGNSALLEAVRNRHLQIVNWLLEAGSDAELNNNRYETARLIAQINSQDKNSNDQEIYKDILKKIEDTRLAVQQYKKQQVSDPRLSNAKLINQQGILKKNGNASIAKNGIACFEESVQRTVSLDIPGLHYKQIPGDGHCLYNAVGMYLNQSQESLREDVASYLEKNLGELGAFLHKQNKQSPENYIRGIRAGKEWAAHAEIEVLMRLFRRPIVVIGPNGRIQDLTVLERFRGDPIFVYYNGYNHYDAFLRIGEISSMEILRHLMQFNERSHFEDRHNLSLRR